jgi:hypothetical protein
MARDAAWKLVPVALKVVCQASNRCQEPGEQPVPVLQGRLTRDREAAVAAGDNRTVFRGMEPETL